MTNYFLLIDGSGGYLNIDGSGGKLIINSDSLNTQSPTLLGNGRKNLAYQSMTAYYENELLKKSKREEEEKVELLVELEAKKIEALDKIEELPRKKTKAVKKVERDINRELSMILASIEIEIIQLQQIREKQNKFKRNLALILLSAACPLNTILIN
jgi:hypothetical protein